MRKHKINLLKSFLISSSIVGTVLPICFANYHNSVLNNDNHLVSNYPNNNNEILISNYLVDYFIKNGVSLYDSTEVFVPKNYNDMLNKKIYFGDNNYAIISGIIKYNLSDFEELKNIYQNSPKNNQDHLFYKSYILGLL